MLTSNNRDSSPLHGHVSSCARLQHPEFHNGDVRGRLDCTATELFSHKASNDRIHQSPTFPLEKQWKRLAYICTV